MAAFVDACTVGGHDVITDFGIFEDQIILDLTGSGLDDRDVCISRGFETVLTYGDDSITFINGFGPLAFSDSLEIIV